MPQRQLTKDGEEIFARYSPARGGYTRFAFSIVRQFCMALLYGRAVRRVLARASMAMTYEAPGWSADVLGWCRPPGRAAARDVIFLAVVDAFHALRVGGGAV